MVITCAHNIGRLRIPQSFIDHIPAECMSQMRHKVVWHKYHMLIGVAQPRKDLTMPPITTTAHMAQQKADIKRNHEVDRLAKMVADLPVPDIPPTDVLEIHVGGGPAPTPAQKWILQRRLCPQFRGTHRVSWLPLKGKEGMEPLEERETPWYSKLKPRQATPNPTVKNLREQCCYKQVRSPRREPWFPPQAGTHQNRVHALLNSPLTHTTKLKTIHIMNKLPQSQTESRLAGTIPGTAPSSPPPPPGQSEYSTFPGLGDAAVLGQFSA